MTLPRPGSGCRRVKQRAPSRTVPNLTYSDGENIILLTSGTVAEVSGEGEKRSRHGRSVGGGGAATAYV